ncbi:MAG: hypothetical protein HC927_03560 [Deltaproteobacteria bacterium]|nr:hypothetical protein [Deltaproteobacteria bacterium]
MLIGTLALSWRSDADPDQPEPESSTWLSLGLGVLDGIVETGMAPRAHNPIGVIRYAWLTWTGSNPARNDRQIVGEWLDSEVLSANPDDFTYHRTMLVTEVALAAISGGFGLGRAVLAR